MTDQVRTNTWFEQHPKTTYLILALICLVLAETLLQGCYFLKHKHFVFNQAFEVTNIERTGDERAYKPRANYKTHLYHINEFGYRGDPVKGEPDVLTLGDSVPFGAGVGDHETYPYHFAQKYGLKTINGGVPSYTFWQSLQRWQKDFDHLHPKVVTFQSTNDLPLVTQFQDKWHSRITWIEHRWQREQTLQKTPLRKSALFQYISSFMHRGRVKDYKEEHYDVSKELAQKFFSHIASSVDDIAAYAKKKNATVVLVSSNPFWYTDDLEKNKTLSGWSKDLLEDYPRAFKMYQMINAILKKKAELLPNVHYFDVAGKMNQMDRNKLFRDPIHHGDYGNQEFARLLHEYFEENKLL